ncbi:TPA: hypothetical protein REF75_002429 [Staphylococcus pseudintermedius]|nr:hypothetical protein [Staphylococcus pseudintermedius]EGQ3922970.1 hypothetical protein [Staphylococcus pseudintermedius]EHA6095487.1 hypothetical protein [Staphylococcus pseudintermedius]EHT6189418.1 hypothetical protein [Staphylococcus pseudintermedius]EHT7654643.1 hypothetical protein [Staphylococcus pseudintermedius]
MTQYINNYYFSLVYTTLLVFFSLPLTHIYTQNVLLYGLMTFVILLSTVVVEMTLNRTHDLKAKRMLWTIVPINVIVFSIFIFFIFK